MTYKITIKMNAGSLAVFGEGEIPNGEYVIEGLDPGHTHLERRNELGHHEFSAHLFHFEPGEPAVVATHQP